MPDTITPQQQQSLRSWLKLLGGSNTIRKALQSNLQAAHGVSLSRFDILANLYRAPDAGIRMSHLSKQLMVSNGNVTQVMAPLIREGLVERTPCKNDARAAIAKLSDAGRQFFEAMASDHAGWVDTLFAGLSPDDHKTLIRIMDKLRPDDPSDDFVGKP